MKIPNRSLVHIEPLETEKRASNASILEEESILNTGSSHNHFTNLLYTIRVFSMYL